jgi:hypothetical protein
MKTLKKHLGPLCFGVIVSLPLWAGVLANWLKEYTR